MLRLNPVHQVAEDLVGPWPAALLRRHAGQAGFVNVEDDDVRVGLGCEDALGNQGVKQANFSTGHKTLNSPIANDYHRKNQRQKQIGPRTQATHPGHEHGPALVNQGEGMERAQTPHHRNQ